MEKGYKKRVIRDRKNESRKYVCMREAKEGKKGNKQVQERTKRKKTVQETDTGG